MNTRTMTKTILGARAARALLAAALLLGSAAPAARAQVQGPPQPPNPADEGLKGVVLKGRAPVSKEVLKIKLPKAQEATLKNGLRVVLLENHRVPSFSLQLVVLSGGLSDPAEHKGLAQFTAALMREGTAKRTSRQIAEELDTMGASVFAASNLSGFTSNVIATGLVENLDPVLDIFADVARNPSFPKDEVEKYKTRTAAQLQQQRQSPQFLAAERFNRAVYGDHPASLLAAPPENLKRTTTEDLARFHQTHYRPNNAMLAVVGDVTMKELLPKLERALGDWKPGEVPKTTIPAATAHYKEPRIYLIDRPGSVQTLLQLGNIGIERTDPDYFALLVMNRILGGGGTARLQRNLREDKGYTYGAGSAFGGAKFRGVFAANSSVRTEVTEGAMREFLNEFKRIRDEKVSDFDLDNAKRGLTGSFALSLEQPQLLLANIVTQKLYDLPADYWDTYPQRVAAVTADDVQRVARKYVDLDRLQVVAVGDASKVRQALAPYGTVEVYDTHGKPVAEAAKPGTN